MDGFTLLNTICRHYGSGLSYHLNTGWDTFFDRPVGPRTLQDGFGEECDLSGDFHIIHDICFVLWKTASIKVCINWRTTANGFRSLPGTRRTPIGALHRLLMIHIPRFLFYLDQKISNGRVYASGAETLRFVMNERHPTVLVSLEFEGLCHMHNWQPFIIHLLFLN